MTGTKTILALSVLAALAMAVFGQQTDEAWLEEGNVTNNQSMYDDAIKDYEEAIRLDTKKYADAWYKTADALKNLGRYDEAFLAYEEAIYSYNEVIQAYEKAIHADDQAFQVDDDTILVDGEVTHAYGEAIPLAPEYDDTLYSKGVALDGQGEHEEATQAYEEAIMPDLEYTDIWYNRGLALADQGKYEEAIQMYNQSICRINKDVAEKNINIGLSHAAQGLYEYALQFYEEAIEDDRGNAKAWYYKSVALKALNRTSEADQAYDKAVEYGWTEIGFDIRVLSAHLYK